MLPGGTLAIAATAWFLSWYCGRLDLLDALRQHSENGQYSQLAADTGPGQPLQLLFFLLGAHTEMVTHNSGYRCKQVTGDES